MKTTYSQAKAKACQAAKWGADLLALRRQGRAFCSANGLHRNVLQKTRENLNPPLSLLDAMASWFQMDLDEFLEEAWAHRDLDEASDSLGNPKKVPDVCPAVVEQFRQQPPRLGMHEMNEDLERIDELRYSDPMRALKFLEGGLTELPSDQLPYALQIAASCYRNVADLKEAAHCLRLAGDLALECENRLAYGDHQQRWVYLLGTVGFRQASFRRAEHALNIFSEAKCARKIGEAIIDRGYCLYYLDEFERSKSSFETAITAFADDLSLRSQAGARQLLALVFQRLGDLDQAKALCEEAVQIGGKTKNGSLIGNSLWLLGRIEHAQNHDAQAAELLLLAAEHMSSLSPLDSLLILLDFFQIKGRDCRRYTDRLSESLAPVANIPKISETVEDLLALAHMNRLTAEDLNRAKSSIAQCRPQVLKTRHHAI